MYRYLVLVILMFVPIITLGAPTGTDDLGTYSIDATCNLIIEFPVNINESYPDLFGTTNSDYFLYNGTHPFGTNQAGANGRSNNSIWNFLSNLNSAIASTTNTITYDVNLWRSAYGNGDKYVYLQLGGEYDLYYPFTVSSGGCVPFSNRVGDNNGFTYQTRFLNATLSATSSDLIVDIDYVIDTQDFYGIDDRPDVILTSISSFEGTQIDQKQKLILPLENGNDSKTIVYDLPNDGNYSLQIYFWNLATQRAVLSRSYLTINFSISGGIITSQEIVDASDALKPYTAGITTQLCATGFFAPLCEIGTYLFVPDDIDFETVQNNLENTVPFGMFFLIYDKVSATSTQNEIDVPVKLLGKDVTLINTTNARDNSFMLTNEIQSYLIMGLYLMLSIYLWNRLKVKTGEA